MSFALQLAAQSGQKANNQLADALLLGVASAEQQVRYETTDNLWRLHGEIIFFRAAWPYLGTFGCQ